MDEAKALAEYVYNLACDTAKIRRSMTISKAVVVYKKPFREANGVWRKAWDEAKAVLDSALTDAHLDEDKAWASSAVYVKAWDEAIAELSAVRDKAEAEARGVGAKACTEAEARGVWEKACTDADAVYYKTIDEALAVYEKNKGK